MVGSTSGDDGLRRAGMALAVSARTVLVLITRRRYFAAVRCPFRALLLFASVYGVAVVYRLRRTRHADLTGWRRSTQQAMLRKRFFEAMINFVAAQNRRRYAGWDVREFGIACTPGWVAGACFETRLVCVAAQAGHIGTRNDKYARVVFSCGRL